MSVLRLRRVEKFDNGLTFDNRVFAVPAQPPNHRLGVCGFVGQGNVQMRRKQSVRFYQSHVRTRRYRYAFCATERFVVGWAVTDMRFCSGLFNYIANTLVMRT